MMQMQEHPHAVEIQSAESAVNKLLSILQRAYSGEMTAALAYRGHWISLKHEQEVEEIRKIEVEEWIHRENLGRWLKEMGSGPLWWLEVRMAVLGVIICIGCNMVGWFIPMYFAGRLEAQNDLEYEAAAKLCEALGLDAMRAELKAMAQLERDHEQYFLRKVTGHPALPFWQRMFKWGPGREITATTRREAE